MKVGVFGAGAIGTYVGVRLSSAGCDVTLVGRKHLVEIAGELTTRNIKFHVARPKKMVVTEEVAALEDSDVVIVAVKSMDTASAVEALRPIVTDETTVVSLQNGLRNVETLSALDAEVLPGMVTFNVVWRDALLEQATSGPILVGPSERNPERLTDFVAHLRAAREKAAIRDDMDAIQAGKLLLNTINGVCAVTGLPVAEAIKNRTVRRIYAACMREGLRVLKAADREVASIGLLSPGLIARALPLPDAIVFRLAKPMVSVDPRARSSTLQDLDRGKKTEIDYLNGEIVRLAKQARVDAPANRFITEQVHALEQRGDLVFLTPAAVYAGIRKTA